MSSKSRRLPTSALGRDLKDILSGCAPELARAPNLELCSEARACRSCHVALLCFPSPPCIARCELDSRCYCWFAAVSGPCRSGRSFPRVRLEIWRSLLFVLNQPALARLRLSVRRGNGPLMPTFVKI